MRKLTGLVALVAAMALGTVPASAGLPVPDQGNSSGITQGDNTASGGNANATGGDGGNADTGNVQVLNGNAISVSIGGQDSEASAEGGDTSAQSGDAYGGDGGDAEAYGGDADASNNAGVGQSNEQSGGGYGSGTTQENGSTIEQGDNTATGGNAEATGGRGGDANTGNTQIGNGNAIAISIGPGNSEAKAKGGDTSAKSGDAYGGDGGDAKAKGGDGDASNNAWVEQRNKSDDGKPTGGSKYDDKRCGCQERKHDDGSSQSNRSDVRQGSNEAKGGDATANGGDGGNADTGNEQKYNGNAFAFSRSEEKSEERDPCSCRGKDDHKGKDRHDGNESEAEAKGGDTSAKSGDAYGGDGGDAKAKGGDGDASNNAWVKQRNESTGGSKHDSKYDTGCGCHSDKRDEGSAQHNESYIEQGDNTATGGNAEANGGRGGDANTGNEQKGNGNAYARSETKDEGRPPRMAMHPCVCQWSKPHGGGRNSEAEAEGGDTAAWSGDA